MGLISPINFTQYENNAGTVDRCLWMADSCMVRKFDPTLIVSGSWRELWIGFRWRVNLNYRYKTGSIDPIDTSGRFMFGVCDTTGKVYGQSGSLSISGSSTQFKHYFGLEYGLARDMDWKFKSSGSYNCLFTHCTPVLFATGSIRAGGISTSTAEVVISENTASIDSLCVIRIYTGSVTQPDSTAGANSWNVAVVTQNTGSMHKNYSSTYLAELLKQPTWNKLTASMPSDFTKYTPNSNALHVNQAVNGYFDGIFMAWNRRYDPLVISDVVVRAIQ